MSTPRDPAGIFLIDKEAGGSSAYALNQLKRSLRLDKVGHTGTLDPFATGLLVCVVGRATRLAPFLNLDQKIYEGEFEFGISSTTDDCTGEVLRRAELLPTPEAVQEAKRRFEGKISQIPPQVSAVKVAGERAYERARRGEHTEIKARVVEVESFELTPVQGGIYRYRVQCGGGTYIRSLARDIGGVLGCGGVVRTLRRTAALPFHVADAKLVSAITVGDLIPWEHALPHLPKILLPSTASRRALHGAKLTSLPELEGLLAVAELPSGEGSLTDGAQTKNARVVYGDESTGTWYGILARRAQGWEVELNVWSADEVTRQEEG